MNSIPHILCLLLLTLLFLSTTKADSDDAPVEGLEGFIMWSCGPMYRSLLLTFNNCPSNNTPAVLDALDSRGVQAVFVIAGEAMQRSPDLIKQISQRGHVIANDLWSRPNLVTLANQGEWNEIEDQLEKTEDLMEDLTGKEPFLVRPPGGDVNQEVANFLGKKGYTVMMWSVGGSDWYFRNATTVNQIIAGSSPNGGIILLHENEPETAKAVPQLIDMLKPNWNFTTVEECMQSAKDALTKKPVYDKAAVGFLAALVVILAIAFILVILYYKGFLPFGPERSKDKPLLRGSTGNPTPPATESYQQNPI